MKAKFLGAAILALFVASTQTRAEIVNVTYTGIVTASVDQTGIFGIVDPVSSYTGPSWPGPAPSVTGAYVGMSYTANYVFDTTKGIIVSTPTYNDIYGGASIQTDNPLVSASATINGHTVAVNGNDWGEIWALVSGANVRQFHSRKPTSPKPITIT
jgi:hypothetical protein